MTLIIEAHRTLFRQELERHAPLTQRGTDTCQISPGTTAHPVCLRDVAPGADPAHDERRAGSLSPHSENRISCYGTSSSDLPMTDGVQSPVAMMVSEHRLAAEYLHTIRDASGNYKVPSGGCLSYLSLYQDLQALERDLHQHIRWRTTSPFPALWDWRLPAKTRARLTRNRDG
jgi:hypothetical protein